MIEKIYDNSKEKKFSKKFHEFTKVLLILVFYVINQLNASYVF